MEDDLEVCEQVDFGKWLCVSMRLLSKVKGA